MDKSDLLIPVDARRARRIESTPLQTIDAMKTYFIDSIPKKLIESMELQLIDSMGLHRSMTGLPYQC